MAADFSSPIASKTINEMTGVQKVVACDMFTLILMNSGSVYVLGSNLWVNLGTSNFESQRNPFPNPNLSGIVGLTCGPGFSLFWNSNLLYYAGYNGVCSLNAFFICSRIYLEQYIRFFIELGKYSRRSLVSVFSG